MSASNSHVSVASVFLAIALAYYLSRVKHRSPLPLPPGPHGTWIYGVSHLIPSKEPWKVYAKWGEMFGGPLVSFYVYNKRVIIINDATAIHELLNNRSNNYSDRPKAWMYHEICDRKKSVFNISSLDSRHKQYRKLIQGYLGRERVAGYVSLLQSEISTLLDDLNTAPNQFENHFRRLSAAIIMKLAYGYEVEGDTDRFVKTAEEAAKISGWAMAPGRWLVDYYPIVRFIPSFLPGGRWKHQGAEWRERLKELSDVPHSWVKSEMERGNFTESFTSSHLSQPDVDSEQDDIIKWCAGGLYAGAFDTTVSALISFLLIMALHPEYQSIAQAEIDFVLESARLPEPSDLTRLPYLKAILKEVLRYAPVSNLALPHKVVSDDTYAGYFIPKDATIIPNVWAVMHDPYIYTDPFTFDPNRFYDSIKANSADEDGAQGKNASNSLSAADSPSTNPRTSNAHHEAAPPQSNNDNDQAQAPTRSPASDQQRTPTQTYGSLNQTLSVQSNSSNRLTQIDPMKYAFGFGRRTCPGIYFAETMILLTVARILQRYVIKLPAGTERPRVEFTTGITSHIKPFQIDIVARSTQD
ncbi:hypothetical protein AX16_007363 [Volvariella volvacea WC 439]|nr:hypothetical protein AX16_007363 [Volvariella volvacea WC 439]